MSDPDSKRDPSLEERAFFEAGSEAELDADPMGVGRRATERATGRRRRSRIVFVVFLGFLLVLGWLLLDELVYFFSFGPPLELGRAEDLTPRSLPHNHYVEVSGIARDMCIRADVFGERLRFLYLLGSEMGSRILIQAPDPHDQPCQGAIERTFRGRLLDLARSRRFDAVLAYYGENFPAAPRDGPMYLLQHDVRPGQAWYYPAALGLLLLLAGANFLLLLRAGRRAAAPSDPGGDG